ncbi:MAG TPA: response regulator, partial [Anaeromyxobacteraceae bacterium]
MPLSGKRLLVVEEGEELGCLVAAAATALGASAVVLRGGRAALAELDASGADAAIVDLPLPDVRGDAFLVALRDRGVPCVAVSGVLRGAHYAAEAARFGAAGFFEKPFRVEEALELLSRAIPA